MRLRALPASATTRPLSRTVSTYVLIAIVKKQLHLHASLYTLLQILSVSVFEKTKISCALQLNLTQSEIILNDNQLTLFSY
jgi:hypothetical protein